ncbi:MoaD/ThiS family protein [Burkholderia stagnalis]|uniref:MoaD/ThiS family protein n=1 Tax=Burkholderia vietnamiensis TaxID=60552 RepID=UPI001B998A39|nr:MoaD/ThiS family protein [Burkholderia vietnamiensis]MBR8033708.1 MoaD/ThiS family protein [Burkholderia vietnamiensis]HDR9057778.1 MoaD/ThiS family protein [Burkholderia vietnamiensis]
MAQINIKLPASLAKENKFVVDASNLQQAFEKIGQMNRHAFDVLFRESGPGFIPKAFVAMFVNDDQAFDVYLPLSDGDRVSFDVAIAGG